jgi:probable rRNA maturation factor
MTDLAGLDFAVIRDVSIPSDLTDDSLQNLVQFALDSETVQSRWRISIAFVDIDKIVRLHEQFMGLRDPTDILTFADEMDGMLTGDIAICVPVAAEQADAFGHTVSDELAFLVLHGVLHLLGYRDETDHDRERMLGRQDELLRFWRQSRT